MALGALASTLALAVSPEAARAAPSETPASDAAPTSAEELADQAYQLHAEGRYAEAIAAYLKAYALSSAGATLFNVATIYDRKLHESELASDYYRRYLRSPDAEPDLVQRATERLTALKREGEEAARAAAPAPAPVEPLAAAVATAPSRGTGAATSPADPARSATDAPGPRGWHTGGIVVGALGVAGVATSMAPGLAAKGKDDDANQICQGSACATQRGVTLAQEAGSLATAATIAFVAGLACVGGGVALYLAAPGAPSPPSSQPAVVPQLGPTGAGMSLRLEF